MARKVKLSTLVGEYLRNGHVDYAAILYLAAKHGEITLDKIYKICKGKTRSGIRSWLTYLVKSDILKRKTKATYTPGPALEPDIDEATKIFKTHGIDPTKIEEQANTGKYTIIDPGDANKLVQLLELHVPGVGKVIELYRKHGAKLFEFEKMLQELARLRTEVNTLREENDRLRRVVEDYETKIRQLQEGSRKQIPEFLQKLLEMPEVATFLEIAASRDVKVIASLLKGQEVYDVYVREPDQVRLLADHVGTRQEFKIDNNRKIHALLERLCLCIEK